MKHIVTISLVFFSLTQLAKAERVESLRILTERYCNKQHVASQIITQDSDQSDDYYSPLFLSNNELASIGALPQRQADRYQVQNQAVADKTVVDKPKNNSP